MQVKRRSNRACEGWLREPGMFSLERRLRGGLVMLYNCLNGACSKEGVGLFFSDDK